MPKQLNLDEVRLKAAADVSGAEQRFLQAHAEDLSAEEVKRFELVTPVKADDATTTKPKEVKASEVTGTEGQVLVQAADLKAINDTNKSLGEKVTNLEASVKPLQAAVEASQKKEAEAYADELIGKGKIVASQKDDVVKRVLADASTKELLDKLPENKLLGDKQGSSTEAAVESPREQAMKKAKELMAAAEKPLGVQAALEKVYAQDPELAHRAADENRALAGVTGAAV